MLSIFVQLTELALASSRSSGSSPCRTSSRTESSRQKTGHAASWREGVAREGDRGASRCASGKYLPPSSGQGCLGRGTSSSALRDASGIVAAISAVCTALVSTRSENDCATANEVPNNRSNRSIIHVQNLVAEARQCLPMYRILPTLTAAAPADGTHLIVREKDNVS